MSNENKIRQIHFNTWIKILKFILLIIQKGFKIRQNNNNKILRRNKSLGHLKDDTLENYFLNPDISYHYDMLLQIIPKNTKSRDHLIELIINKNHKKKFKTVNSETTLGKFFCCNPDCRVHLEIPEYFAYDGTYCSIACRTTAQENLREYWYKI